MSDFTQLVARSKWSEFLNRNEGQTLFLYYHRVCGSTVEIREAAEAPDPPLARLGSYRA